MTSHGPPRTVHVVAGLLVVGLLAALAPTTAAAQTGLGHRDGVAGDDLGGEDGAVDAAATGLVLLGGAMAAARTVPHDARMVVAGIGEGGEPSLRQHLVRSRPGSAAVLAELDVEALGATHRVRGSGRVNLQTGPARVVGVGRTDAPDRERLFVDDRTGLLVRREVFDGDGRPVRVVAYTDLTVVDPREGRGGGRIVQRDDLALDDHGLDVLHATGWHVRRRLGDFRLLDGHAADQGPDGSVLHLRYADGLYALSLYEQVGPLDHAALTDAVPVEVAGGTAWHWPGASPQRLVLSGGGLTFTVVSEAPMDVVLPAIEALPNDQRPNAAQRMTHGAKRVVAWAWPFD